MPKDMRNYLDYDYVKFRLESAGRTIMMLPDRVRPTGYPSSWPEHLRTLIDTLEVVEEMTPEGPIKTLRVIIPDAKPAPLRASMREINEMNEVIFNWQVRLAAHCLARQIPYVARCVALGMLHYPDTGRKVWTWVKLAEHFKQKSRQTPKNWYDDGIEILVKLLNH